MTTPVVGGAPVWRPTAEYVERSRLTRFMRAHRVPDYATLYQRSIAEPEWFWGAALRELGIEWYRSYTRTLDESRGTAWARWFRGGQLNLVHNCLEKYRGTPRAGKVALRWEGEDGAQRQLTYAELDAAVSRAAGALRGLGVGRGDRVALLLPMIPEVAIVFLACAKLGAIAVPAFSGFAAEALASRVQDSEARVIVTADGCRRRGRAVGLKTVADAAAAVCPSVRHLLVVRRLREAVPWTAGRDVWWHEATAGQPAGLAAEAMTPDDPFMIIYTSGTTGRPKGTVHTHGGFPVKATLDMGFHFDVQDPDVLFWLTDMGWMMGPWAIVGVLTLGATLVLYEGAPDHPHPGRLWELVARHGVSVLGIAPTAIRALMRHGEGPLGGHARRSLRVLGSSGEPWTPEAYRWYGEQVGEGRCPVINYSGGTEIAGGIVAGTVLHPSVPCAFAGPWLGTAADVYDAAGRPVRGEVGELVITRPWPGMTQGFWGDPRRYEETYWGRWPGVWVHGDWALIDEAEHWYILGRSDDTIKVAGKRVGPAEVEAVLTGHAGVSEAAAVGVPDAVKGECVACFVVLRPGQEPSEALRGELVARVAGQLGKALTPAVMKFAAELPRTRSGKVMRRVIRAVYLGEAPGDLSSLDNPQGIEAIRRAT